MRCSEQWQPTKYVQTAAGLRASRDPKQVGTGSRFVGDILAVHYEKAILTHARGIVLDLGCGFVPLYATYCGLVSQVVCADWQNTLHPSPHLDFQTDLNQPLPIKAEVFDAIFLTDVLEHISEPISLMKEIGRILRPGGKLILGVPFMYWLHEQPHDYYRYTEHALRRFCSLSGLDVLELEPYGGLREVLLDHSIKGIEMLPQVLRAIFRPMHSIIARLSSIFDLADHWSKWVFPLGYVVVAWKPTHSQFSCDETGEHRVSISPLRNNSPAH